MTRKSTVKKTESHLRRLAALAGITMVDEALGLFARMLIGVKFEPDVRDEVAVGWFAATAKLYPILKADLDVLGPKYKAKARKSTRRK